MLKTIEQIMKDEDLYLNEGNQWGTDKFTKHPYAKFYEPLLESYRNKPIKFLEIGAYHGASTIIWDKFFPYADITVVDVQARRSLENIKDRVDENRTRIVIADAYTQEVADTFGTFDVINDDGPHDLESMKNCIKLYYPKLNQGGVLIIEDIPDASWFEEFKKLVPDSRHECVDYSGEAATDSRIFAVWKD